LTIELELQIATDSQTLPHPSQFRNWVDKALSSRIDNIELTVRIVDNEEMLELNKTYKNKNSTTNVLSFPMEQDEDYDFNVLGDIIICAPVIVQEAHEQNKDWLAHWAHMVIHGCLHLVGYDHDTEPKAVMMEGIEIILMQELGFKSPYE